mmetsp:Transcript_35498/g.90704  ORF Transcript_35498/g.90704 Transcript_35498/m.90704 type:complete len:254 (-) Transcript_35498:98-859(-)
MSMFVVMACSRVAVTRTAATLLSSMPESLLRSTMKPSWRGSLIGAATATSARACARDPSDPVCFVRFASEGRYPPEGTCVLPSEGSFSDICVPCIRLVLCAIVLSNPISIPCATAACSRNSVTSLLELLPPSGSLTTPALSPSLAYHCFLPSPFWPRGNSSLPSGSSGRFWRCLFLAEDPASTDVEGGGLNSMSGADLSTRRRYPARSIFLISITSRSMTFSSCPLSLPYGAANICPLLSAFCVTTSGLSPSN